MTANEPTEREIQLAATAWCGAKTRYLVMDVDLAQEFAKILREYRLELIGEEMDDGQ
jgi:hypothetical protein